MISVNHQFQCHYIYWEACMWFTARFHFSCYWFNSNLPGLPELDFIRKIWVLVLFFFVFFPCNISSESFYSKTLQRQTWCLRENGDKSIATHNTCRVLNNGSYLDRAHSAAVLLMCFTSETKGINIFCVFCADKCCCFMLFSPVLFNSRRQKHSVQFRDLVNLTHMLSIQAVFFLLVLDLCWAVSVRFRPAIPNLCQVERNNFVCWKQSAPAWLFGWIFFFFTRLPPQSIPLITLLLLLWSSSSITVPAGFAEERGGEGRGGNRELQLVQTLRLQLSVWSEGLRWLLLCHLYAVKSKNI